MTALLLGAVSRADERPFQGHRLAGRRAGPDAVGLGVNGCASVVSGVLAAIISLSAGFTAVLLLGQPVMAARGWRCPRLGARMRASVASAREGDELTAPRLVASGSPSRFSNSQSVWHAADRADGHDQAPAFGQLVGERLGQVVRRRR